MRQSARWLGLLLALGVTVAAADAAPGDAGKTVTIKDFKYAPGTFTVPRGTKVTWVNHDEEVHTVTSETGAFASVGLTGEDTFTQTFTRPGTYKYFCALHPKMRATVVVR